MTKRIIYTNQEKPKDLKFKIHEFSKLVDEFDILTINLRRAYEGILKSYREEVEGKTPTKE